MNVLFLFLLLCHSLIAVWFTIVSSNSTASIDSASFSVVPALASTAAYISKSNNEVYIVVSIYMHSVHACRYCIDDTLSVSRLY